MNLRNVTIWTTGVLPILVIAAYTVSAFFADDPHQKFTTTETIIIGFAFWFIGGLPLMFVSCAVARKLKSNALLAILFAVTIIHASLICLLHIAGYVGLWRLANIWTFLCIGITSLPVMISIWVHVLVLERRYVQKQEPQE